MTTKRERADETALTDAIEHAKIDARRKRLTIPLAIVAVLIVGWVLHQIGVAMTADRTPLSCTYSSTDAHAHDESCYRDGTLVCPVPERAEHHHDDSCYKEVRTLTCTQEEGDGHTHGDSCYQVTRELSCGKEETTGPHVHTEDCFPAADAATGTSSDTGEATSVTDATSSDGTDATVTSTTDATVVTEATQAPKFPEQKFDGELRDAEGKVILRVAVNAPEGAFPEGTTMEVKPLDAGTVQAAVDKAVASETTGKVTDAQAADITFHDKDGREIEPAKEVTVRILSDTISQDDAPYLVHVDEKGDATAATPLEKEELAQRKIAPAEEKELVFAVDEFSPYVVVATSTDQTLQATDGDTYDAITVDAKAAAGIPSGSSLQVTELLPETAEHDAYMTRLADELGGSVGIVGLYDISIVRRDGTEVQPQESVGMRIDVPVGLDGSEQVVHFADDGQTELIDASVSGQTVSLDATGFSVYAIVESDTTYVDGSDYGWIPISTLDEVARYGMSGICISHPNGYYATNDLEQDVGGTAGRTGIAKTQPATQDAYQAMGNGAARYYFEQVSDEANRFVIWCLDDDGQTAKYVRQDGNGLSFVGIDEATIFTVQTHPSGGFRIIGNSPWCWNMQGGNGGKAFASYNNLSDANARLRLQYYVDPTDDPFGLSGKTYGMARRNGETNATSLATTDDGTGLVGHAVTIRPDILDNDGILLASGDVPITEWEFQCAGRNVYYLSTEIGGRQLYLALTGDGPVLTDAPGAESEITVVAGTGSHAGLYQLIAGGEKLVAVGKAFNTTAAAGGEGTWMTLVTPVTELEDSDFVQYTARKVNVSDRDEVPGGSTVILYTRVWNADLTRYEYFVVSYDGSLLPVHESGDMLSWIGGSINTEAWEFTEHLGSDGKPNWYYELRNTYSGQYVAPQLGDGQILSDSAIGINLNGRRYGDDNTTIVAWDDPYYDYAGLRVSDDGKSVVSCPLSQADDFCFAMVEPVQTDEDAHLTEVRTMDNSQFGISVRMVDYNNEIRTYEGIVRDMGQVAVLGDGRYNVNLHGLLRPYLEDDGYPLTNPAMTGKAEQSLSALYADLGTTPANHLFLQGTYDESGYFEYDSAQNFAKLGADGNFTVYDQLAGIGTNTKVTLQHGQFMPYNSVQDGLISPTRNMYAIDQTELLDTDPRKGERLYLIPLDEADYYFGMEMEASFTQTPDGLDAWGHDIVFEFSGDDDFWLYVDGILVIDLGGVHSAMEGSVNFRTGQMVSDQGNATLRELFEAGYRAKNPSATDADVAAWLDGIFEEGTSTFKAYTNHDMKIFYMERGASASNLHMRFNLAAAKPNTVVLNKTISGTDHQDYALAEFPYQVWYTTQADGEHSFHLLGETREENGKQVPNVTYSDRSVPVKFAASYTPAGGSHAYENVFFLQGGQSADIRLPDDAVDYYIVECGINPGIYDGVKANGTTLAGAPSQNTGRRDYRIDAASLADRPRVTYDNHVSSDALRILTITKRLFDVTGNEVTDDPTGFTFRLSLASEDGTLTLANMYPYSVRDEDGNYCRWDYGSQSFVPVGAGKADWSQLTDEEKDAATFSTSIYGTISKIPARYHVEVRDLIVGTKFLVEEYDSDTPEGYALKGYHRVDGTYIVEDSSRQNSGTIRDNSDPEIEVHNSRGWGLTAKKAWSDADFMSGHDPIYMAVYVDGSLLDGSIRQLPSGKTKLYWFFLTLEAGKTFDQYEVREVTLGGAFDAARDVDSRGVVRQHSGMSVNPIDNGGTLTAHATPKGESAREYTYDVTYAKGEATGAADGLDNVRTDVVSNTREGIRIVKEDAEGNPLAGARFALTDEGGSPVGADSYESDENGLVTVAYLANGSYRLDEVAAPSGYRSLAGTLGISATDAGISLGGDAAVTSLCSYDPSTKTITVRDKRLVLTATKVSPDGTPLPGAHFALYRQVEDGNGNLRPDYTPIAGHNDLVTGDDGTIPNITQELATGTYYLRETRARDGYAKVAGDLCLTIGAGGEVSCAPNDSWRMDTSEDGTTVRCSIAITDDYANEWRLSKVDEDGEPVGGARFTLRRLDETTGTFVACAGYEDFAVPATGKAFPEGLSNGIYSLEETQAPDGDFQMLDAPVYFRVHVDEDTLTQVATPCDEDGDPTESDVLGVDGDTIAVVNRHVVRIALQATKRWETALGTPLAWPVGTTVTLGLYERHGDALVAVARPGTDDPYEVTLDGEVDLEEMPAGTAQFRGVPDGADYVVCEVRSPLGYEVAYSVDGLAGEAFGETRTATVTNRTKVTSISVTKEWDGGVPPDATATMRLYSYVGNPASAEPVEGVHDVTLPQETGDAWVATFSGLPEYDESGNVKVGYLIREVEGTLGYRGSYAGTGDYAADGGTITNVPTSQDFTFDKVWVGLAAIDAWPDGEVITVEVTRSLVSPATGIETPDEGFAARYVLSANRDGTNAHVSHVGGTTTPLALGGGEATVEWDGQVFTLRSLPMRGTLGGEMGLWEYRVGEVLNDDRYDVTYRMHGANCPEGTTSVGNGGTIVNTLALLKTYELPKSGGPGREFPLAVGMGTVAATLTYVRSRSVMRARDEGGE